MLPDSTLWRMNLQIRQADDIFSFSLSVESWVRDLTNSRGMERRRRFEEFRLSLRNLDDS